MLTLNYILGVGCLGVPYAFERAGIVLSAATLMFTCLLSFVTVMWVCETVARAEALAALPCEKHAAHWACLEAHDNPMLTDPSAWKPLRDLVAAARRQLALSSPSWIEGLMSPSSSTRGRDLERPLVPTNDDNDDDNTHRVATSTPPCLEKDFVHVVATAVAMSHGDGRQCTHCVREGNAAEEKEEEDDDDASPEKSYEITELAYKFMGPYGKLAYQISLMILMYAGLLAYSQVFLSSVASLIPAAYRGRDWLDPVLAGVFALVVIPLSTMKLTEQLTVQTIMALTMQLAMAAIVLSTLLAIFVDDADGEAREDDDDDASRAPYLSDVSRHLVDFSSFGLMLSTALFSQLFQHSVPGLVKPLAARHKKGPVVRKIFGGALVLTTTLYVLLGLVATLYFGDRIETSINLNWNAFRWTYGENAVPLIPRVVNKIIVVVPALNTLSVFPLIAITLGNNLHVSMHAWVLRTFCAGSAGRRRRDRPATATNANVVDRGRDLDRRKRGTPHASDEEEEEDPEAAVRDWIQSRPLASREAYGRRGTARGKTTSRLDQDRRLAEGQFLWRLLASLPPVVISAFYRDLSMTLAFSGLPALFVAFVGPAVLEWTSARACMRSLGTRRTVYTWHFSRHEYVAGVLIFAVLVSGIIVMQLVQSLSS